MKRYIKTAFILCCLGAIVITLLATFILFSNSVTENSRQTLRTVAKAVEVSKIPDGVNLDLYTRQLADTEEGMRVTLLTLDGEVLGDSDADFTEMENHAQRPEVQQCLTQEFGEDIRKSETTGERMLYLATCLSDGRILRLSRSVNSTYAFLEGMLLPVLLLCAVLILVVNLFASRFSKRLIQPLQSIQASLVGGEVVLPDKEFSDIKPVVENIRFLIDKLNHELDEIKKTEQMRTDFVANVSHELKSPLTSVKGFAELISAGLVPQEKQQEYLNRIVKESDRLLGIINDLLLLSRAESTEVDPGELEAVRLEQVTNEVCSMLSEKARQKNVSISITGQGTVQAVSKEIFELIYNLVDNAIKYNVLDGIVKISMKEEEDRTTLKVADTGIGIEPEEQGRIFERFYRVDKARSRKAGGTGLGLAIAKHLAARYDGSIELISEPGKGSEFIVVFVKQAEKTEKNK